MEFLKRHWALLALPYWTAWVAFSFASIKQEVERHGVAEKRQLLRKEIFEQRRLGLALLPKPATKSPSGIPKKYQPMPSEKIPVVEFEDVEKPFRD